MSKRRPMGALEAAVMAQLWKAPDGATPADVLDAFDEQLAYTTVMTILTRLWEKGLATRERVGKAYVYKAALGESELTAQRMQTILAGSTNRKAALSSFVEALPARDVKTLEALLREARKR